MSEYDCDNSAEPGPQGGEPPGALACNLTVTALWLTREIVSALLCQAMLLV